MLSANMDRVEAALRLHGDSLMRIAFTYTRNMDDAQDMVQEAFIRYMTKAPEFKSPEHEKAWLIRITINLCKNHLSSAHIKTRADLDENISTADEYSSGLWEAVSALPDKYSITLHLFYYEGYNIKEIAKLTNITTSAVATRLQRGREMLREKIGDDFG